jgi:hypothetical protein
MGHLARMHTVPLLAKEPWLQPVFVTHTAAQAATVRAACGLEGVVAEVVHTGLDTLVENRNYALDMVDDGEWFVGLDDNVQQFTGVPWAMRDEPMLPTDGPPPDGYASWRAVYRTPADLREALRSLRTTMLLNDTFYGGFASMENPYFRARNWSYARFVKSKAYLMRKVPGVRWETNYLHDSYMSALAVAMCGCVVVDNWTHPVHTMYEAGGLGGNRQAKLAPELPLVLDKFGGLVKKARGENSALRFVLTQRASIDRWRNEHFYT